MFSIILFAISQFGAHYNILGSIEQNLGIHFGPNFVIEHVEDHTVIIIADWTH